MKDIEVLVLPREQIDFGDRRRIDYGDLEQLATSIKEKGLIQPIAVWRREDVAEGELPYLLLAGGRRFLATEVAGVNNLPCRIFTGELSDLLYREIELIENIERKDLSWQEQVQLQKEINDLMVEKHGHKIAKGNQYSDAPTEGWSKRDTANLLGRSPASVVKDIQIADALTAFPVLGEAKTKSEAEKLLKKLKASAVEEVLLAKLREQEGSGGIDAKKKSLMDNYIIRDFFEGVRELPDGSVNLVEIDPPYAIDLHNTKRNFETSNYEKEDYNEMDPKAYRGLLARLFKECYRVMAEHSWLICWYAPEPWAEEVYTAITAAGFKTRRINGLWIKPTGQTMRPESYLANAYEPFYYACKGNPAINRPGRTNVYAYPGTPAQKKIHPTERPVELIQDVLSTFVTYGARVMVPFLGSGNTLLAAANLKVNAFGFDLSKGYKDGYMLRVQKGIYGRYRSYEGTDDSNVIQLEEASDE